jgi:hypothetical protein
MRLMNKQTNKQAAWRLAKKEGDRERGARRRGNDGSEVIQYRGNKGGQIGKDGRGRVEESGEPGMAAPVQAGHLELQMHG